MRSEEDIKENEDFWDNYFHRFSWTKKEDKELKKIAMELGDNLIFCDRHLGEQGHMLSSVFMTVALSDHFENHPTSGLNEIARLFSRECFSDEKREKFLESIGLIYEYYDKAGPMSINGFPIFFSHRQLSKDDTLKVFEHYEKYMKMKNEFEN